MAGEYQFTTSLQIAKNGVTLSNSRSSSLDMSGTEMIGSVQQFTTSEAQISLGGCDSAELLQITNLDEANNLTIGFANPLVTVLSVLKPGASCLVAGVSTTLYAKSSAGTVEAFVLCGES